MSASAADALPVLAHGDRIVRALREHGRLIVCAPPGSGKSTCIPRFFLDEPATAGSIIVLQPRRIAARSLAAYCSRLAGEPVGQTIGYQVRFDAKTSARTRLLFQTYGVFVKQLASDPHGRGIGLVILDEFHERTLEMDLVLAWLTRLRAAGANGPRFIVMSATLDGDKMRAYLGEAPVIDIDARVHPVAVSHQSPKAFESPEEQAARALQSVVGPSMDGSVLVFMPGVSEISRTISLAADHCRRAGVPLLELHGRLDLDRQMAVMDQSRERPCVIVATNVAETSLTIPGVTTVIDSGYERRAAYDPAQDRNTLRRRMISRGSATQRAGRAGRVAPGRCIRLWSGDAERAMEESVSPEIERLELSAAALAAFGLLRGAALPALPPHGLAWLTEPSPEHWDHALDLLADIGAIAGPRSSPAITDIGMRLLSWPADPLQARILLSAQEQGVGLLSAAIIALWENLDRSASGRQADLFDAAIDLAANPRGRAVPGEVRQAFEALCDAMDRRRMGDERRAMGGPEGWSPERVFAVNRAIAACWLPPLRRRIAAKEPDGSRYLFADGKAAAIQQTSHARSPQPPAIIALTLLETRGPNRSITTRVTQYIPIDPAWIADTFPDRVTRQSLCRWDEGRQAAVAEVRTLCLGLVVSRTTVPAAQVDPDAAADLLTERLLSRQIDLVTDDVRQLVARARLIAGAFPDKGFPTFTDDDWRLIYHILAHGASSRKEVEARPLLGAVKDYLGPQRARLLDTLAPVKIPLPSGRTGTVAYFESSPPELSARIGDLIGMKARFTVCEGRVHGVFDILAPNYRTVQKTADLAGFWKNAYPQIKGQLQRKYPKHPWP